MEKNFLAPAEIFDATVQSGITKTSLPVPKLLVLGLLAGAFIAFGAAGSNMAAFNLLGNTATVGLGRLVAGSVFPVGLMMVVMCGAELFTGNSLIFISVLQKKTKFLSMLRNWLFVYIGNFIGAMIVVFLVFKSGQFGTGAGALGGTTIKIAYGKICLQFWPAFCSGILCNWLVCLAVWLTTAGKDIISKMFGCFFPIMLFVTAGFEHSIANMYYVPAGILAKNVNQYVAASGVQAQLLAGLNWGSFFGRNLLPVTLGNIIGGTIFVALAYWFSYGKKQNA